MMNLGKDKLRGKKIGILAGDGFEYAELAVPKAALRMQTWRSSRSTTDRFAV